MSDRELLEMAAKAAGYDVNFDEPVNDWYPHGYDDNGDVDAWWNPLNNDGDALRLAAKLELRTSISGTKAIADWWRRPAMSELDNEVVPVCDDPCAALRLAIVRAAAEIGKATP